MKKSLSLRHKTFFMVVFMAIVLSGISTIVSYYTYKNTMENHYSNLAISIATSAAKTLNVDEVSAVRDSITAVYDAAEDSEKVSTGDWGSDEFNAFLSKFEGIADGDEWKNINHQLESIRSSMGAKSVYLLCPVERDKTALYLCDSSSDDLCMPGCFDNLSDHQCLVFEDPNTGFEPFITNYPEYGWIVSTAVPIMDESGQFICLAGVDISMEKVVNDRLHYLEMVLLILGVITLVMCTLFIFVVERTVTDPINKIAEAARNYISGENERDSSLFTKLKVKTGDEIENLSAAMTQMAGDIDHYITDLTSATAERERIGAELDLAKDIQANYLPTIFPPFPDRNEFDIYATMDPAKEVGGDFYDFFLVDDDHIALVMADVSGKGVPAALFMMISKTLIKNQTAYSTQPGEILYEVNNRLCENNIADMFCTAWLGILEISTGKFLTASAGHEYPAICRAGGSFELFKDKHGMPLGGMECVRYRQEELQINPGDVIYVYTDGVAEATNAENELYGTERMLDALNSAPADRGVEQILADVRRGIDDFVKEAPQFDDITMLAFHFYGKR